MRPVGTLLALLLLSPAAGWAGALEELLPEDTAACLIADDWTALRRAWDTGVLAALWNDTRIHRFLDPTGRRGREEGTADWEEVRRVLDEASGQLVLAVPRPPRTWVDEPSPVLLMDVAAGDSAWTRLGRAVEGPGLVFVSRTHRGVETRVGADALDRENTAWALVDGVALVAARQDDLAALIDALLDRPTPTFADSRLYYRAMVGADLTFMVNLRSCLGAWRGSLEEEIEEDQPFVTGGTVWAALGLDALEGAYAAVDLAPDVVSVHAGVFAADTAGVVQLWPEPVHMARPALFPAGAVTFGASAVPLRRWWSTLLDILAGIDPALAGEARGRLVPLARSYGVDLEEDLFAAFGDAWYTATYPAASAGDSAAGELEYLVAIPVADRAALQRVLDALEHGDLGAALAWETLPGPGGVPVHVTGGSVPLPGSARRGGLAYALAGDFLVVSPGGPALVARALETGEGASLREDAAVTRSMGWMGHEASSLTYIDTPAFLEHLAREWSASAADGVLRDPGPAMEAVRERLGPYTSSTLLLRVEPAAGESPILELLSRSRLSLRP